jgi:hypothetical protein
MSTRKAAFFKASFVREYFSHLANNSKNGSV